MITLPHVAVTETVTETETVGRALGEYLRATQNETAFLAMYGDLGAGKTAFSRGLASVITPGAAVASPTYTIVNEYRGEGRLLCHFDMYRIESEEDLYSVGFYDYEGMIAAEWCEKTPFALPTSYLRILIEKIGEETRRITVQAVNGTSADKGCL